MRLVPHAVGPGSVELWLTTFDEFLGDGRLQLLHQGVEIDVDFDPSTTVRDPSGTRLVHTRRAVVADLVPAARHRFDVRRDGQSLAAASLTTPPTTATVIEPFNVLLASCFDVGNNASGLVARSIADVRQRHRVTPHLQVFCGDQVYVDDDPTKPLSPNNIDERLHDAYRTTWGVAGLGPALSAGLNVFTPDDHELWNNAPRYAPLIPATCATQNRFEMASIANRFFAAVQSRELVQSFDMAGVPFFVADTRLRRRHDFTEFLPRGAFARLQRWVQDLSGPGVLVLGQPIVDEDPGRLKSTYADAHLSSYEQYADLLDVLDNAPHDMFVLSGDVHFGRIASVTTSAGNRLTEIISSPTALISPLAAATPPEDPFIWPPGSGSAYTEVATVSTGPGGSVRTAGLRTREHFMTLSFVAAGGGFDVQVTAWLITLNGATEDWTEPLMLRPSA